MTDQLVLTIDEAAAILRVSRRTVYRLIGAGRIRVIHPTPGRTLVERREIEAYLAWCRRAA